MRRGRAGRKRRSYVAKRGKKRNKRYNTYRVARGGIRL